MKQPIRQNNSRGPALGSHVPQRVVYIHVRARCQHGGASTDPTGGAHDDTRHVRCGNSARRIELQHGKRSIAIDDRVQDSSVRP